MKTLLAFVLVLAATGLAPAQTADDPSPTADDQAQAIADILPVIDLSIPGSDLPSDMVLAVWNENDTRVRRWWIYYGSARSNNDYFNRGLTL